MKLLLSKIWGLAYKSSHYLDKSKSYGEFAIYLILYGSHVGFGGRWVYFTILFETLADLNVGIDTKTKPVDGLIRHIFVIE